MTLEATVRTALTTLLLLLAGPVEAGQIFVDGRPELVVQDRNGRTTLRIAGGRTVSLTRDGPCEPCALRQARIVGERPGAALILLLTYESRPGAPTAMCGAGEEEILHIVSLRPRPREAVARSISSCWHNHEADRAPSWDARQGILTIRRWTPESGAKPERLAWRVAQDGRVDAVSTPDPADEE